MAVGVHLAVVAANVVGAGVAVVLTKALLFQSVPAFLRSEQLETGGTKSPSGSAERTLGRRSEHSEELKPDIVCWYLHKGNRIILRMDEIHFAAIVRWHLQRISFQGFLGGAISGFRNHPQ